MTHDDAKRFASEWVEAWNRHDIDAVLAHYTDDFEMTSPMIQRVLEIESGALRGKQAVGDYWRAAIRKMPDLAFSIIAEKYPGVFTPEWLFGGKKHGWSLRYKKSKSFCTMIPEKGRCLLVIVFGHEERAKVDAIHRNLSARVQEAYDQATTYHDGKWLRLNINNKTTLADAETLLAVKRRPKA